MTHDDHGRFAKALGILAVAHGEALTEERIESYWITLADLPIEAIERAALVALRTRKFFPKPAELLELAGCGLPDVGLIEALLCEHFRYGRNVRRFPDDPFLRLVVERLGGPLSTTGMDAAQRIFAIGKILPGVVTAAQARGLALPSEAQQAQLSLTAREMARRALAAAEGGAAPYDAPPPGDAPDGGARGHSGAVVDFVAERFRRGGA